jgi:hypothetical protein
LAHALLDHPKVPFLGFAPEGRLTLRVAGLLDSGQELLPAGTASIIRLAREPGVVVLHQVNALGDGSALRGRAGEEHKLTAAASDRLVIAAESGDLDTLLLGCPSGVTTEAREFGPVALTLGGLRQGGSAGRQADRKKGECEG